MVMIATVMIKMVLVMVRHGDVVSCDDDGDIAVLILVAQRRLMKEIKEGRKEWHPRLFRSGAHPHRGPLAGLYTTRENVRTDPPPADPLWHELIAKEVFTDL